MSDTQDIEQQAIDLALLTPAEAAERLGHLDPEERSTLFEHLAEPLSTETFQLLEAAHQQELLDLLPQERVRRLVESLDPDDRARLLEEMPGPVARRLLSGLSIAERRMTAALLGFPEESAGRVMTPEFLALDPGMNVGQALQRVRRQGPAAETIYVLPLIDPSRRLLGLVHLKDLLFAEPDEIIDTLIDQNVRPLGAMEDQEVAARLIQATDALAAPVVDAQGHLLGLVTVDDAMDILDREKAEDLVRAGGAEPLTRPYFSVSLLRLARARVVWLLVLALTAVLTVNILSAFEETLEAVVTLALFIPLLIGIGGNSGAQSATTLVRAMSVGELVPSDLLRVLAREAAVGLTLGAMLATVSLVPVWLFAGQGIALVVALTLLAVCGMASCFGAIVPLVAQRLGVDPAIASAPFITTLIDAAGLVVYFLIAQAILF